MPGKHHLGDRIPQHAWMILGGILAVAFVAGMVLLVQNNNTRDGSAALFEQPRSAAVVSAAHTPSRTVSSRPPVPSLAPATSSSRIVEVEPQARPVPPPRTTRARPPRTSAAPPPRPRPASAIAATYAVGSSWDTGFIGSIEVSNTGRTDENVTISVRHDTGSGVRVVTAWNATLNRQGDTTVFTGGPLAPGATLRIGFEATKRVPGRVRPAACTAGSGSCRVS